MNVSMDTAAATPNALLERYYQRQAPIYDLTRWAFLFGRGALLRWLAAGPAPDHLLEVGCGTGHNLARLARLFPTAHLTGVDLSDAMLVRAERRLHRYRGRVAFLRHRFEAPLPFDPPCDVVLFSYSLSMMNPGWDRALRAAARQLQPGGLIAVVDFAGTSWPWFRRWMAFNHVRLEGHLRAALGAAFRPRVDEVRTAYGGMWSYFWFIGQVPDP